MSEADPIRVLLVDDHLMVRKGLEAILLAKPDLTLVGEASNGEEAVRLCEQLQPDVVLMDLLMPVMDGLTATRAIRERCPQVRVIALTSSQEQRMVQEALRAGAIGYLLKNVSADELAEVIRSVHAGLRTLAPEAVEALIQTGEEATLAPGHDLTSREREVLALLVDGLSNPDIARQLGVSRSTIKSHVSHILGKLGVTSRAEAISLTLRQRFADPE